MELSVKILQPNNPEVFDLFKLRVFSQMNSPYQGDVNFENYPKGIFDDLDLSAYQLTLQKSDQIVAATRINILQRFDDLIDEYRKYFQQFPQIPRNEELALMSRAFVHPEYREQGLMKNAIIATIDFIKNKGARYIILCAAKERIRFLKSQDFQLLGESDFRSPLASTEPTMVFLRMF